MAGQKLYECENTIGTKTKWQKGTTELGSTYEGICKGQAVLWCRNMLDGQEPSASKPEYGRASALQVLYERRTDGGDDSIFARAGMATSLRVRGPAAILLDTIVKTPGVFQIRYTGHALAAANVHGKYYFFDSEQGLYEFGSADDFWKEATNGYEPGKFQEMWQLVLT